MAPEVPSINLLNSDPVELQLYTSLKTAQQKVPNWPGSLPVPVLCTVGMQSAGKTTFIEALVGFRIGTTCAGTGTRCPVRYILKHGEPHFAVSGKRLRDKCEIQVAVERHMEGLALQPKEADRFSREELQVEITDKNLPLLDITDLPGLKAKGEGAEEIKSVVRFYVQSQSARPVVLVKATESVETQADVELLRDVGIDSKKGNVTFIVNYFNDQLYKFSKVSELNAYCRGYVEEYHDVFFCMLIYSAEAKTEKDNMDFEGQCKYYRELPGNERQAFEHKVLNLTRDQDTNENDVTRRFGVTPAVNQMQAVIRDFILREGRRYASKVRVLEEQYDAELKSVDKELKKCNPDYIKEQRERYIERWGEKVRDLQQCRLQHDREVGATPMDGALTLAEELEKVKAENDGLTIVGDTCKPEELPQNDMKLTADASLNRLNSAFELIINKHVTIDCIREDEARSISGYAPGDMPGAFDKLHVRKEVATRPMAKIMDRLWPMLVHVLVMYENPLETAHKLLEKHPGFTDDLKKCATEAYVKHASAKLREQHEEFCRLVKDKTMYPTYLPDNDCDSAVVPAASRTAWHSLQWYDGTAVAAVGTGCLGAFFHGENAKLILMAGGGALAMWFTGRWFFSGKQQASTLDIESLNGAAKRLCDRLKRELLDHIRHKVSCSLFHYFKRGIIDDVREDLRQQIREVDAKRIDDETKARATELRVKAAGHKQSLVHIRQVLGDMERLNNARDEVFVMA